MNVTEIVLAIGPDKLRMLEGYLLDAISNLNDAHEILKDTKGADRCETVLKVVEDYYDIFESFYALPEELFEAANKA